MVVKIWLAAMLRPDLGVTIFKWAVNRVLFRGGNYPASLPLLLQTPRSLPSDIRNAVGDVPTYGIDYFPIHAARFGPAGVRPHRIDRSGQQGAQFALPRRR